MSRGRAHGTRTKYVHDGCRCLPCRMANARYAQEQYARTYHRPWRSRCVGGGRLWLVVHETAVVDLRSASSDVARARRDELNAIRPPRAATETPHWISPAIVRRHLRVLQSAGIGLRRIAELSGVSYSRLVELRCGLARRRDRPRRRRLKSATAERIFAVAPHAAPGARVPAAETWARITALRAAGWSKARIARALGKQRAALQLGRQTVLQRNAAAVARLVGTRSAPAVANALPHPEP